MGNSLLLLVMLELSDHDLYTLAVGFVRLCWRMVRWAMGFVRKKD